MKEWRWLLQKTRAQFFFKRGTKEWGQSRKDEAKRAAVFLERRYRAFD